MTLLICIGGTEVCVAEHIAQFGVENAVELCEHIWAMQLSDASKTTSARDRLLQLKVKPESIPLQVVTVEGWSLVRVLGPSSLEEVRAEIPSEYAFSIQPRIDSMKGTQITFFVGFCGNEDVRARVLQDWQALGWACGIVKNNALYADVVGMTGPDTLYKRSFLQSMDNPKYSEDQLNTLLINKISLLGVFYPPMPITTTAKTPSPAAILQAGRRSAPEKSQRASGVDREQQYAAQRMGMDKNRCVEYDRHVDMRHQQQMAHSWGDNNPYYSYRELSSRSAMMNASSGWGDSYRSDFFCVPKTASSPIFGKADERQGYSDYMVDQASDHYMARRRHDSCDWDMSTNYTHCDQQWPYGANEAMMHRHGSSVNNTSSSLFLPHDDDSSDNNPPNANDIPVPSFISRRLPMTCASTGDDDRMPLNAVATSHSDALPTSLPRANDGQTLENEQAQWTSTTLVRAKSSDWPPATTAENLLGNTTLQWLQ
eukprot:GEMP01009827.1.p1 GENE.GEMP01009827.1~~GEMP01009827.1.p1  ORF type:complete len:484 (-),score=101.57 GEMP01009827.1:1802-3253(-)